MPQKRLWKRLHFSEEKLQKFNYLLKSWDRAWFLNPSLQKTNKIIIYQVKTQWIAEEIVMEMVSCYNGQTMYFLN